MLWVTLMSIIIIYPCLRHYVHIQCTMLTPEARSRMDNMSSMDNDAIVHSVRQVMLAWRQLLF